MLALVANKLNFHFLSQFMQYYRHSAAKRPKRLRSKCMMKTKVNHNRPTQNIVFFFWRICMYALCLHWKTGNKQCNDLSLFMWTEKKWENYSKSLINYESQTTRIVAQWHNDAASIKYSKNQKKKTFTLFSVMHLEFDKKCK